MPEYRTAKQFEEIAESMENGNWTQAAEECVEYGFSAADLKTAAADYMDERGYSAEAITDMLMDLITLTERAMEVRHKTEKPL